MHDDGYSDDDDEVARVRAELTEGRIPLATWAAVKGVSERQAYNLVNRHQLSFITLDGVRWIDPREDIRHGKPKERPQTPPEPPRGPGRPRKAAAVQTPQAPRRRGL